jgi:hypothetical protein
MFVASAAIVCFLRRFPRSSIAMLGAASLFTFLRLRGWAYAFMAIPSLTSAHIEPGFVAAFAIASLGLYSFPVALILAWPLWSANAVTSSSNSP